MKKIISTVLAVVVALSVVVLIVWDNTRKSYQFGMGISASYGTVNNATATEDGSAQGIANIAAVIIDEDGIIVKCVLDCADSEFKFKNDGTAFDPVEYQTKFEKGYDYNMITYGGAKLEWFEQANAFAKVCEGKTIDQVKALVANGQSSDEVIKAGCTIYAGDFIKSVEVAVNNAKNTTASPEAELNLGVVTSQENGEGTVKLTTTVVATAIENGKITAASTDAVEFSVSIDNKGVATVPQSEIKTKHQLGEGYGMVAYGGAKLEWFEQANAFSSTLIGKDASQIPSLMANDGKGNDEVQTAGCTIYVSDFVKAAVKATD